MSDHVAVLRPKPNKSRMSGCPPHFQRKQLEPIKRFIIDLSLKNLLWNPSDLQVNSFFTLSVFTTGMGFVASAASTTSITRPGVPQAHLEKYIATLELVETAVPDMSLEIHQIVAARRVRHAAIYHSRHPSPRLPRRTPSKAAITMPAMGLVRVQDGLLAEGWYVFDSGMLIMQSPIRKAFSAKKEG